MRKLLLLGAFAASFLGTYGQSACGGGRILTEPFANYDLQSDITFGQNFSFQGTNTVLKLDVYEPQGDVLAARPLVVIAHGGNFLGGDKAGADVVPIAEGLARSGLVVASINYRVGIQGVPFPGPTDADLQEAVLRAVHDMKAAVRFFYKDAATANAYKIDTNMIFVAGASAGAVTALHYAYLDNMSEVPSGIDTTQVGLGGGLAGNSGNPGYSDRVAGVINLSGALDEASWLVAGDEPLVSTHAVADDVVPYGSGQLTFLGIFQLMVVDGSNTINTRAQSVGVNSCLYTHEGAGVTHVPHAGSAVYLDTTMVVIRNFLNEIICNAPSTNCAYTVGNDQHLPAWEAQVIPNPAIGDFVVELGQTDIMPETVQILDMQGRVLRAQPLSGLRTQVARNGLPAGSYLLRITDGEFVSTQKLILY